MSLSPGGLLWSALVPLLLGVGLLRALGVRWAADRLGHLGWAWLAGTLGLGALLFVWAHAGLPWSAAGISAVALALSLAAWILGGRLDARAVERAGAPRLVAPLAERGFPRWERALFGAVLAGALVIAFERLAAAAEIPVIGTDESAIWAAKAKALYWAGGFGPRFHALAVETPLPHPDYPPLNPLLQLWVFVNAGGIVHFEGRVPIQLFAPAATLALASALRRRVRPGVAALLLILFPALRVASYMTYRAGADLMVAFGFAVALDALLRWREERAGAWLALACLALAHLFWSKNEGLFYALALALAGSLALVARRWMAAPGVRPGPGRADLAWLLVPLVFAGVQAAFNAVHGFRDPLLYGPSGEDGFVGRLLEAGPGRAREVLRLLWSAALEARQTNLLLPAFLALVALHPRRAFGARLGFATLTLCLVLAGYVLIYCASFQDLEWHLATSGARVVFQCLPAVLVWLALATRELFPHLAAARLATTEAA